MVVNIAVDADRFGLHLGAVLEGIKVSVLLAQQSLDLGPPSHNPPHIALLALLLLFY